LEVAQVGTDSNVLAHYYRFYRIVNEKKSAKFARRSPPRPVRMGTAFAMVAE